MVYFKVLLNDKRPKTDNIYPVVVRVTHNRNNTTLNTCIRVKDNLWDDSQGKVLNGNSNSQLLNKKITEFYLKVQKAVLELEGENNVSFETLKERINDVPTKNQNANYWWPAYRANASK